jgi:CubicO group peptidase (beta-lactamase class C family)
MVKFIFKTGRALVVALVVVLALAWAGTIYIHYPNPIQAARLGFAAPSDTPTLMPANQIPPSTTPINWPTAANSSLGNVDWYGVQVPITTFLTATHTNAFLIVRNGTITYEWYAKGITVDRRLPSYSVAKTLVAMATGELIKEGKLRETDTFVSFFPEYKTGTDFDKITVGQLIDMRGGVNVPDDYPTGPSGWGAPIAQMYATTSMTNFIQNHRGMAFTPGSQAIYRSVDTQMMGMLISKVSGMSLADFVQEHFWNPIGAQYLATWNIDHKGGYEKSYCCFNAAARDYAKLGELMLNGGMVDELKLNSGVANGAQIIDPTWMTRLTTTVEPMSIGTKGQHWGYGSFVWHPYPDTNLMLGLHDQFVFMVPNMKTVIVKLSDNTQEVDEVETAKVLHTLALAG